jgi:hypothetical protein
LSDRYQDPNPLPGSLQYYQVHYIVEGSAPDRSLLIGRCIPVTKGHFGSKRVVKVKWETSDVLATALQSDSQLDALLKDALLNEGEIRIDPLNDHVRIYGRWKHDEEPEFNPKMFEAADRIAMHIKEIIGRDKK